MFERAHLSKIISGLAILSVLAMGLPPHSDGAEFKKKSTGLYRDVFDANIYHEVTNFLHLERLYRSLFNKELRSGNVNIYDEVPDSTFFTNRQGKAPLNAEDLKQGILSNEGPDFSQGVTVNKGKFEGLNPGFWIKDSKGDIYLLKFDPADNYEMSTAAEVIASRFMHAIGYNVPEYTLAYFDADQMHVAPDATTYDDTGFKKQLTAERLEEYLIFVPQSEEGRYRAAASKLISGENLGFMPFWGTRKGDGDDLTNHETHRELRALRVFASWLNIYDIRETNTIDALREFEGKSQIKHYFLDFGDALGSAAEGPKPPMFTHEHMLDYGEMTKAFFTFGFWKKPWQKRWEETGMTVHPSPAIGYFDNRGFHPGKYKTQLPYYAFKDLTLADAFWATKIIMSFSDEEIRTVVETGQYSKAEDADYIAKTLIERRDIIGKFWFGKVTPLDHFEVKGNELSFEDLSVKYGFEKAEDAVYQVDILDPESKKGNKTSTEVQQGSISIDPSKPIDLLVRKVGPDSQRRSFVAVKLRNGEVAAILHQD